MVQERLMGGEMATRVRDLDWSSTPLGVRDRWPASLRTATELCLHSRFPTAIVWGDDLTTIYNDAYAAYLGPEKHPDALGRPYREVWREIWPSLEPLFARLMAGGEASWHEDTRYTVLRHGFEEESFFTFALSPIPAEGGEVGGAMAVVVETTRRVLATRRLQALEDVTAAALNAHTVQGVAQAIGAALARHPEDLPFALLYQIQEPEPAEPGGSPPLDTALLVASAGIEAGSPAAPYSLGLEEDEPWPLAEVFRTGGPVLVGGLPRRFPDLPRHPWPEPPRQALVLPLHRPTGDPGLRAILVAGISPRLAFDAGYEAFLRSIARQTGLALADALAHQREREARSAAEAASRAKSEFLAAMSHELRTPLNAISGYVDLLEAGVHGPLSEAQQEALERIGSNQRHLLALINDVLLYSRIEASRITFERRPFPLAPLIEGLDRLVRPRAEDRSIGYTAAPCPDRLLALGDPERVRQILLNLIGNAIKFTDPGGAVNVDCGRDPATGMVEIRVIDTGPGIAAEKQETIFDPFSQIDRRLDRPREGTGLGLAISRDLARGLGGDLAVESELGDGSTFVLRLPVPPAPS